MKHALVIIAALVLALVAFAQDRAVVPVNNAVSATIVQPGPTTSSKDWPTLEVFGGASYQSFDLTTLGPGTPLGRKSAYGWETSVSNTVYRWFAIEGSVSGYYGQASALWCCVPPVNITSHYQDYSFLGGPRFNLPKGMFFHALFGANRISANDTIDGKTVVEAGKALKGSETSYAISPGFGFEARLSRTLALRTSVDYVMTNFEKSTQNHFRASVGPVFRFGGTAGQRAALPRTASRSAMRIPALGVVVTTRQNNDGAEIVELMPGSAAELSGLRVGDVLDAVDGAAIKTPMDLAVELSGRSAGSKITIGHITRGYWHTETVLILAR